MKGSFVRFKLRYQTVGCILDALVADLLLQTTVTSDGFFELAAFFAHVIPLSIRREQTRSQSPKIAEFRSVMGSPYSESAFSDIYSVLNSNLFQIAGS